MTMRGFDEEDFREVGRIICGALGESPDLDALRVAGRGLRAKRPLYPGFRGFPTYTHDALAAVTVVDHPLVQHKLSYLRDARHPTVHFRKLVNEVTLLLTYEATKEMQTEEVEIETPLERMTAQRISGKKVAVCPVLRAGMGMLDGVLSLVSSARVGFIGLYRDEETLEPVEYSVKLRPTSRSATRSCSTRCSRPGTRASPRSPRSRPRGRTRSRSSASSRPRRGSSGSRPAAPRRPHRLRRRRPRPERARLHRPGPRRRGRPPLRHEVALQSPAGMDADDRPPICPRCGVTMVPAALSADEEPAGEWVCLECEELDDER